ncbi:FAD-dependent oxidoreductase [Halorhabdus salina]|uniref:FAD-dependent oxidoreductase n=1 Tax=Halorhabdus salina TaxID=2750670 RepID=UPI0015EF8239|nr:FAD-dependent oxidoreductase [Halorhabdus salina]
MSDPFVIVGGDAAGMSAASKAKREDPDREVIVLERGEWVSYGACGLPYYVKGEIDDLEDLVAIPAERFREERDIDLRTGHEVTAIDPEARTVTVSPTDGEPYQESYDDLLIATGARALDPPIEGRDHEGVFSLQTMDAGREIRAFVESTDDLDSVAVVGGGYVGIEMAEAFDAHDLDVSLFEMREHVLPPFGPSVGDRVAAELRDNGVTVHTDTRVERIAGDDRVTGIETEDETHDADAVLLAAGVEPRTELASEAGIEIGPTGAIATDADGHTSHDGIYAAGDCTEATHTVTGDPAHVPLALTANRAGRAIGSTVGGDPIPVGEIAGTAVLKAFDLAAGRTGVIDEERAREAGFDPASVTITAPSRAHYYPGGDDIEITLLGDRESGRVLGASMVGTEGVAKRLDTVATALHEDLTAQELSYLDLSYAPPFSPTWDPVLTAGKVLASTLE